MANERNAKVRVLPMLWTLGVLIAVTVAAILWGPLLPPTGSIADSAEAEVPIDGGTPIQRARIDDYTARVAKEKTFEELATGLNSHEDLLISVMARSQEPVPEMMFEMCLANRRLARMFEILKTRGDVDADETCRKLFDEKLGILRKGHLQNLEMLDGMGGPRIRELPILDEAASAEEAVPQLPVLKESVPAFNDVAVAAAVFLSAEFCPVEEVLRQLGAWNDVAIELSREFETRSARWEAEESLVELVKFSQEFGSYPQSRFQLSLLASMLQRRFGIDPGGTWEGDVAGIAALHARGGRFRRFDLEGRVPEWAVYRRIPLCAWDAGTNPFDFTHVVRGVPVDDKETFGEFLVFRNVDITGAQEERDQILADLRKRLLEAAAEKESRSN